MLYNAHARYINVFGNVKMKLSVVISALVLGLCFQSLAQDSTTTMIKAKGILDAYISGDIKTLATNNLPSKPAWEWLKNVWEIDEPITHDEFASYLTERLQEDRQSQLDHNVPLERMTLDSSSYLGVTVDVFKASRVMGGVETCSFYLSHRSNIYEVIIALYEYEGDYYFYPENGIQWKFGKK